MRTSFLFLIFPVLFYAQTVDSTKAGLKFTVQGQYGTILKTNFFLHDYVENSLAYQSTSLMISKQMTGEKFWHRAFNNPSFGLGFSYADYKENSDFGNPAIIYANYTGTAKTGHQMKWDYWVNFGISFNSNPYNYLEQYYNVSLSSKKNMYVGFGTEVNRQLGKYFDIGFGFAFNHLSNGATSSPNKGLNYFAPQLSLSYHLYKAKAPKLISETERDFNKVNTLELSSFFARKHVFFAGIERTQFDDPYTGYDANIYGLEGLYTKQISYKSSMGLGIGLIQDEQYNSKMVVRDSTLYQEKRFVNDRLLFSVFPTYRLNMDRLKIDIALGFYPFKDRVPENSYLLFQRVAIGYLITDRLKFSFGVNAHDFHRANYLEWKLGYTIFKKKRK